MTYSVYDVTVPVFLRGFASLSAILDKGLAHAQAEGIDPADYVGARLIPDMLPLSGQVQRASDTAKGCVVRLSGAAAPAFPDEETSFADLQARIAKTVDVLKAAAPAAFEGAEAKEVILRAGGSEHRFTGSDYIFRHALPNFFFHFTTAYDILRMKGVPVGKQDFLAYRDR